MKRFAMVLSLLALSGCTTAGTNYTDTPKLRELTDPSEEMSTTVRADAGEWRNSGIMLRAGATYRVRAEGSWRAHPICKFSGPNGEGHYGGLCVPVELNRLIRGQSHTVLTARIGTDGEIFAIGAEREFLASQDGVLFFHINEVSEASSNNEGAVTAHTSLARPTSPALARPREPPPPRAAAAPPGVTFRKGPERPDDIAVIIGNSDYGKQARDIPDVKPAHADAEGVRLYATQTLGVREGNLIMMKDATSAQMTRVFGSEKDHRGQLFDWVKSGRSRVFVYYSGHGAPGSHGASPYLVPADADGARIELNGYPLKQLYDNLGKLPAESVTVVLEACFSGVSPAGAVVASASPVFLDVKSPPVPSNLTIITAGAANQMASWEKDGSSGLFTKYFLKGMAGEADVDKDGRVGLDELESYLKETLTYYARRHYGRDQNAQIIRGKAF